MIRRERFQERANRDDLYRELVKIYGRDRVRRSSMRNQEMHPEYIRDWNGPVESGYGNTQYKTFFPVVYTVEVI